MSDRPVSLISGVDMSSNAGFEQTAKRYGQVKTASIEVTSRLEKPSEDTDRLFMADLQLKDPDVLDEMAKLAKTAMELEKFNFSPDGGLGDGQKNPLFVEVSSQLARDFESLPGKPEVSLGDQAARTDTFRQIISGAMPGIREARKRNPDDDTAFALDIAPALKKAYEAATAINLDVVPSDGTPLQQEPLSEMDTLPAEINLQEDPFRIYDMEIGSRTPFDKGISGGPPFFHDVEYRSLIPKSQPGYDTGWLHGQGSGSAGRQVSIEELDRWRDVALNMPDGKPDPTYLNYKESFFVLSDEMRKVIESMEIRRHDVSTGPSSVQGGPSTDIKE